MGNEMFNEEQLAYAADLAIQRDGRGKAIERCIVTLNHYGHEVTDDVSETIDYVCTALAAAVAKRDRLREALRALCLHADEWRANGWVPATGALDDAHAALGVKP